MKILYYAFIVLTSLTACKNGKNETEQSEESKVSSGLGKEVAVFYANKDSFMYVKRYIVSGNAYSQLNYSINITRGGFMLHKQIEKINYPDEEAYKKSRLELGEYNWQPRKGQQEIVAQIKHHAFKSDSAEMAAGEEIINKVSKHLHEKNLGISGSHDIGADGLNIIFSVENIDESLKIIMNVIEDVIGSYKLEVATIIARKVLMSDDKWFLEALYPEQFVSYININ